MAIYNVPIWIFLLLVPIYFLWRKIKQQKTQNRYCLPPSPPKLPLLGNLHQIGQLPHQSLAQLSRKYGPVMLFHYGSLPVLIISSREAAEQILKTHDLRCCSRPTVIGSGTITYNNRDISFSPYGDYWRQMRKISVLHLLSVKTVQSFKFSREEEIGELINSLSESSDSGSLVDLSQKIYALIGSIVLRIAFGRRFKGSVFDKERFSELVKELMTFAGGFSSQDMFPYVGWVLDKVNGYHVKLEKVCREMDSFFEEVIDDHVRKPEERIEEQEDIIDVMLRIERDQRQNDEQAWFSRVNIKAILVDIFLGGIDTSSNTIIWAMAELIRNPRVMKEAQDEIRNYLGRKATISEEDIDEFQYLKLIIKETLRLHPVAPLLLPRETISHVKVNGFDVYPKTVVQVNVWSIGRDPKYWKNPEDFYPERFMDNLVDYKGQNFEFIPFGSGRRICPGMFMGLKNIEVVLSNLLFYFDWKLPLEMKDSDINMEEDFGMSLTITKRIPLQLVPVKYF